MDEKSAILRELKRDIARERIVILLGTGVSAASTANHPYNDWRNLLRSGIDRCSTIGVGSNRQFWEQRQWSALEGDIIDLLGVAQQVESRLRKAGGEFATWLRDTIGSIRLGDSAVLKAIEKIDAPIATTNYDLFIEQALNRSSLLLADGIDVADWLSASEQSSAILHLHGIWRRPETVILGHTSYQALLDQAHAQFAQRVIASTRSFLFIGCGEGLEDPNLGTLIDWIGTQQPSTLQRHYRLCTNEERQKLLECRIQNNRVFPVSYGAAHIDLLGFLETIAHYRHLIPPDLATRAEEYRACIPQMIEGDERWMRKDQLAKQMAEIVAQQNVPYDALEDSGDFALAAALALAIAENPKAEDIPRLWAIAKRPNLPVNVKYKIVDAFKGFAENKAVPLDRNQISDSLQCLDYLVSTHPRDSHEYKPFSDWAKLVRELFISPH